MTTHAYDWCGNETSLTEPGQPTKQKAYDLGGRLTEVTALDVDLGSGTPKNIVLEEYTY